MKVKFKKLPASQIELEAALGQEEFNSYWQPAYEAALKSAQIKGFRPGAAPKELAEQVINKGKVFEEAAERAIASSLRELSAENEWSPIDKPIVGVLEASPFAPGAGHETGLRYKATLTIFPEINLGNYKKIAQQVLIGKQKSSVSQEEVEKAVNWLRRSRAKTVRVSRGARMGDLLDIDVMSFVDGAAIPGGTMKGDRFILGESKYIHGFDDNFLGHKEKDALDFSVNAPADYWQKDLRGKAVNFKSTVNGVFEQELPAFDDGFAQSLSPNFQNAEAIKASIETGLLTEKTDREKERLRAKIIEEIIKQVKIDPPQIMLDRTLDGLVAETREMLRGSGNAGIKDEELKNQLQGKARQRLFANLVLYKIAETEKLEPTKEEVQVEAQRLHLDPQNNYDYSYGIVQNRKVLEFLENSR